MSDIHELFRLHLDAVGEFRIIGPLPPPHRCVPIKTRICVTSIERGRHFAIRARGHDVALQSNVEVDPFLFEQTSYQFELGLEDELRGVIQLRLRGQNLLDGRSRVGGHAVYCVPVNFRSSVGFTEIELWCGNKRCFCIRVEVFPTKLDYRLDLAALRADLQMEVRALVHALQGKTFQNLHQTRGLNPRDIEWIILLKDAFSRMSKAFEVIARSPLTRFVSCEETASGNRHIRSVRGVRGYIRTHAHECAARDPGHFQAFGRTWGIEKLPNQRKTSSFDTDENRFIATALFQMRARVGRLLAQLSDVGGDSRFSTWISFLKDADRTFLRWQKQTFLAALPRSTGAARATLALHSTVGYREFFKANLSLSAFLEVGGGPLELPEKDLATLYELWCFIALANILRSEMNLVPRPPTWLRCEQRRITLELVKGRTSILEMERESGELVRVVYNRFDRTPTGVCRPDNTLEIFKRGATSNFRYIFDAKYRLKDDPEYLAAYHAPGPPPDAIYRMHAYRDQIVAEQSEKVRNPSPESTVWDLGYRRWVQQTVGAFVLYPYAGSDAEQNKFVKSINSVGVGGLPFLPSRRTEVMKMLRQIIETSPDAIEDTSVELSTVEERQRIEWAHEYGLIAIVRSPEQLNYIQNKGIYHMPYSQQWGLRLRADFLLLLLSEASFPGLAGVGFEIPIKSVHFGERNEISPAPPQSRRTSSENDRYIWFRLGPIVARSQPLRYSGQPPKFAFTTRLAYQEAVDLPDLLLIREPERRFRKECEAAGLSVQVYDESASTLQVFDVGQLRLRFKIRGQDLQPLNVRFDPVSMQFRWSLKGYFSWNELMFEPRKCVAKLRDQTLKDR